MNTQEILEKFGLDFTIEKEVLFGRNSKGDDMITPYFGLFNSKTNECINTAKAGYTVSQNQQIVDMILKGMKIFGSQLSVTKAGSINGGRRVYLQLAIDGMSKVGNDEIKRYVTVIDSNDGSTGLSIGIGDKNMWCENEFFKFYKAGQAKFRHTATITEKINSIPMLIETSLNESLRQVKVYDKFLSTPLSKNLADKMVKEVLGYDRVLTSAADYKKLTKRSLAMMDTLYDNIETEINHSGNNLWSLLGGVTRYTTHHQITPKRENGKEESLIVGVGYKKSQTAFNFCLEHI